MEEYKARLFRPDTDAGEVTERKVAIEAPVSIELNGIGYAVMMATPSDLEDFVIGFAISEMLVESAEQIGPIDIFEHEKGWIVRANLVLAKAEAVFERARTRVAESSCGLCGLENLELVARPLPQVPEHEPINKVHIFSALEALHEYQPMNNDTGGVHAAAWVNAAGEIGRVREDVGRHSALDKLFGAMAREMISPSPGFILTTSRCS